MQVNKRMKSAYLKMMLNSHGESVDKDGTENSLLK